MRNEQVVKLDELMKYQKEIQLEADEIKPNPVAINPDYCQGYCTGFSLAVKMMIDKDKYIFNENIYLPDYVRTYFSDKELMTEMRINKFKCRSCGAIMNVEQDVPQKTKYPTRCWEDQGGCSRNEGFDKI